MNIEKIMKGSYHDLSTNIRAIQSVIKLLMSARNDLKYGNSEIYERFEKDLQLLEKYHNKLADIKKEDIDGTFYDNLSNSEKAEFKDLLSNYSSATVNALYIEEVKEAVTKMGIPFSEMASKNTDQYVLFYPAMYDDDLKKISRALSIDMYKKTKNNVGITTRTAFKEKTQGQSCEVIKGIPLEQVELLEQQFISLGILVGKEINIDDINKANLYFLKDNELQVMRAFSSTILQEQTSYGKILLYNAKENLKNNKKIATALTDLDKTQYLCSRVDDQYIKFDKLGLYFYKGGELKKEVDRTNKKEFERAFREIYNSIRTSVVFLDESNFKENYFERMAVMDKLPDRVYIDSMDPETTSTLAQEIEDRKVFEHILDDKLTLQNKDYLFGDTGIKHVAALWAEYLRSKEIVRNYDQLKTSKKIAVPETKEKAEAIMEDNLKKYEIIISNFASEINMDAAELTALDDAFKQLPDVNEAVKLANDFNQLGNRMEEIKTHAVGRNLEEVIEHGRVSDDRSNKNPTIMHNEQEI